MAILTRVTRKEYPGAIVEVREPFICVAEPTIQELAKVLMSAGVAMPSVIVQGKIYTEETEINITNTHCVV
ncbi:MAG: hypothetical protein KAY24_20195 [Candidatus Eisenbacteria sp.]|nr:hypothetical protein [Candidatus Eisenbacteria bacterium]